MAAAANLPVRRLFTWGETAVVRPARLVPGCEPGLEPAGRRCVGPSSLVADLRDDPWRRTAAGAGRNPAAKGVDMAIDVLIYSDYI